MHSLWAEEMDMSDEPRQRDDEQQDEVRRRDEIQSDPEAAKKSAEKILDEIEEDDRFQATDN
jgi:hypothetical protein